MNKKDYNRLKVLNYAQTRALNKNILALLVSGFVEIIPCSLFYWLKLLSINVTIHS
ncbi:MAG: hypothetical protein J6K42_00930 [Clostridia bacterium]|nr:hypothetical protein [Clostridia bacterium]